MKKAFIFSGQGAQYPGMMKYFYDSFDNCKKVIDVANRVLNKDIGALMFGDNYEQLNMTINTQPCVLAADIMAFEALKHFGVYPDAVAGFSLGEYAALYAAGVFDLETVFRIVEQRAKAMSESSKEVDGSMAAIMGLSEEEVFDLCKKTKKYVVPVNFNCIGQISISGETQGIDEILSYCKGAKIRAIKLQVSVPCHCKYMVPASIKLEELFKNATFNKPKLPVFLNVDGLSENNEEIIKQKMVRQVREPVQWIKTLNSLRKIGCELFIECGPGKTLTNFVKRTLSDVKYTHLEDEESLNETLEYLKGDI